VRPKYPVARYIMPSFSFSFFAALFRSLAAVCVAGVGFEAWGSMRTLMLLPFPEASRMQTPQSTDLCAREPA
jgi:hypothetical protein